MFGIGMPELLLILAVALIVIGPKKLPDLARSLGKAMGEFKRATNDLKQSIEQETGLDEVRESLRETQRGLKRSLDAGDRRAASAPKSADSENASRDTSAAPDESVGKEPTSPQEADEEGKPKGNGAS